MFSDSHFRKCEKKKLYIITCICNNYVYLQKHLAKHILLFNGANDVPFMSHCFLSGLLLLLYTFSSSNYTSKFSNFLFY